MGDALLAAANQIHFPFPANLCNNDVRTIPEWDDLRSSRAGLRKEINKGGGGEEDGNRE